MASDAKLTEYSFEFRYHGPVCYIWIDFPSYTRNISSLLSLTWIRITLDVILSYEVENLDTWVPFNSWLAVILSRRFERVVDACFAVLCEDHDH